MAVIGAGPAGAQAAVSAAHQMRHVLVLDAAPISQRKGRAYWSKSVELQDAPVFPGITGPRFARALQEWMDYQPVRPVTIGGRRRLAGIERRPGLVVRLTRVPPQEGERAPAGHLFRLQASVAPLGKDGAAPPAAEDFLARAVVVASGFDDLWPDIEVEEGARRLYQKYRTVFRYAGNRKGWHVCIRCDGHLHVDEHLAVLANGDLAWGIVRGAQDFTDKMTILTNGEPPSFSERQLGDPPRAQDRRRRRSRRRPHREGHRPPRPAPRRGAELFFDGFILDYGLQPLTEYLQAGDGWSLQRDEDGLLAVDEDGQVLDEAGEPVPGLFAAGDIVAGQRNLIATAFGLGQNAGLAASDLMREW